MLPPSFLQSFSFYFSFLFYCLFTVYSLIEQVNTESWAPQSPAASGLFSLVIVVVAGHGALYPLSQQVRPQMFWLTRNVAIAPHVPVTWGKMGKFWPLTKHLYCFSYTIVLDVAVNLLVQRPKC